MQAAEHITAPQAVFNTRCLRVQADAKMEAERLLKRLYNARTPREVRETRRAIRNLPRYELWADVTHNTVLNLGRNDLLDKYFAASAYTAAWFCRLISSVSFTAIAAGDTAASHGGWTEAGGTNAPTYSGNGPALAFSAAASQSKTVSAPASFTFTGAGTIKGLFTSTITTKDTTTGLIYNAVLFSGGDRSVANTDVVNVTPTWTC